MFRVTKKKTDALKGVFFCLFVSSHGLNKFATVYRVGPPLCDMFGYTKKSGTLKYIFSLFAMILIPFATVDNVGLPLCGAFSRQRRKSNITDDTASSSYYFFFPMILVSLQPFTMSAYRSVAFYGWQKRNLTLKNRIFFSRMALMG